MGYLKRDEKEAGGICFEGVLLITASCDFSSSEGLEGGLVALREKKPFLAGERSEVEAEAFSLVEG